MGPSDSGGERRRYLAAYGELKGFDPEAWLAACSID
jgi:hypothetical protein